MIAGLEEMEGEETLFGIYCMREELEKKKCFMTSHILQQHQQTSALGLRLSPISLCKFVLGRHHTYLFKNVHRYFLATMTTVSIFRQTE